MLSVSSTNEIELKFDQTMAESDDPASGIEISVFTINDESNTYDTNHDAYWLDSTTLIVTVTDLDIQVYQSENLTITFIDSL